MIGPAQYLRKKLFELLHTNIVYDGNQIPVYEGEGDSTKAIQILIADYSDADSSNKTNFGSNASQVIEIVSEQAKGFRKTVDEIGELVMQQIHGAPNENKLSGEAFTVMVVGRPSIRHIVEESGSGSKLVRLILRYNLLIQTN